MADERASPFWGMTGILAFECTWSVCGLQIKVGLQTRGMFCGNVGNNVCVFILP
jgi:hypothetical protein